MTHEQKFGGLMNLLDGVEEFTLVLPDHDGRKIFINICIPENESATEGFDHGTRGNG